MQNNGKGEGFCTVNLLVKWENFRPFFFLLFPVYILLTPY